MKTGPKPVPAIDRLLPRVLHEKCPVGGLDGPCWIWQGGTDRRGYGMIGVGSLTDGSRGMAYTHRITYEAMRGPIPVGLQIDHLCRVPLCCQPSHLEPVTREENLRRQAAAFAEIGRCRRGHLRADAGYTRSDGTLRCRTCDQAAKARRAA